MIEQAELCLYAVVCVDKYFKNICRTKLMYRMSLCLLIGMIVENLLLTNAMVLEWIHVHGNALYQSFDMLRVIISHVS